MKCLACKAAELRQLDAAHCWRCDTCKRMFSLEAVAVIERLRAVVDKLQPAARSAHSLLCGIMGEQCSGRPVNSKQVFEVFTILNQAIGPLGTEAAESEEPDGNV